MFKITQDIYEGFETLISLKNPTGRFETETNKKVNIIKEIIN